MEERFDQSVWVRFRDRYLAVSVCEPQPKVITPVAAPKFQPLSPGKPGSTWMKGFDLRKSPPLWQILRQEQGRPDTAGGGR